MTEQYNIQDIFYDKENECLTAFSTFWLTTIALLLLLDIIIYIGKYIKRKLQNE